MFAKDSLLRIYAFSTVVSVALIAFVGINSGLSALALVLILAALELTFSFDNAVINAKILRRMSHAWQQIFLTVGILIAVFGVRVLLPILIVASVAGLSFGGVIDLALNNPTEYGHKLEEAHPMISSFGGMFLLMIFLDFIFTERPTKWIKPLEKAFAKAGRLMSASVIFALAILLAGASMVHGHERETVLFAGLVGILSYLVIRSLDGLLRSTGIEKNLKGNSVTKMTFKAGLISFLYLEMIDASFSLDGVIGAFAITNKVLIIAIGLGIGALFVRTITIHMLRKGVLEQYKYLDHGAHYAIGILATLMIISLNVEVSEVVTGLSGLLFVVTALGHSYLEARSDRKKLAKARP
ncbi:MAG TPA: DUF475 domain-containing protein [Candidatus Saccharimonadales bacterium]|nr:DUF475 domain-containing protein [Candidatus Saccharimonadales bacterium]